MLCVPMRLPVHNKLPAGSLGVYYRDGMPCNMWGNENGADDETITCLTLAAISDLSCERHGTVCRIRQC
ncbi:hypothetical protein FA039_29215 [Escherichia coli]|nr:hypothetical protein [Escherichia coli]